MLTIGELAARFGLATHVLRHWEDEGLLSPARRAGRRQYDDSHVARVVVDEQIRRAQESKRLVEHALSCAAPDFTECSHFHRLVAGLGSRTG